jgi:transcriptional regulator with XRE-family HTH domain
MYIKIKRDAVEIALAKMNKQQRWLADETGIDASYLSRILKGDRNPSPNQRENIQKVLEIADWDG